MAFNPTEFRDCRTALYRLFNSDGVLLYVGITKNVKERMKGHSHTQTWWPEVAKRTVTWYDTRPEADDAEEEAIRTEKPAYNRSYRQAAGAHLPVRPVVYPAPCDEAPYVNPAWADMLRRADATPARRVRPVRP